MHKKVYEVQGMSFRLRPSTPRYNRNLAKVIEEDDSAENSYEMYLTIFRSITEPVTVDDVYDNIDLDDFDIKIAEDALANFLPRLSATLLGLIES